MGELGEFGQLSMHIALVAKGIVLREHVDLSMAQTHNLESKALGHPAIPACPCPFA